MKTKSFLFAALVSVTFATSSCQKEESIVPNVTYSSSPSTYVVGTKTKDETPDEYTETTDAKPQNDRPAKTALPLPRIPTRDNIRPETDGNMR